MSPKKPTPTVEPSAREAFAYLKQRRMESRPIVGKDKKTGTVILGAATFRNVVEDGVLK